MMNNDKGKQLISLILIAVGLAMGIAVLVLSLLNKVDNSDAIRMLSLGFILYGIFLLQNKIG